MYQSKVCSQCWPVKCGPAPIGNRPRTVVRARKSNDSLRGCSGLRDAATRAIQRASSQPSAVARRRPTATHRCPHGRRHAPGLPGPGSHAKLNPAASAALCIPDQLWTRLRRAPVHPVLVLDAPAGQAASHHPRSPSLSFCPAWCSPASPWWRRVKVLSENGGLHKNASYESN